jgi:hypothetical protein
MSIVISPKDGLAFLFSFQKNPHETFSMISFKNGIALLFSFNKIQGVTFLVIPPKDRLALLFSFKKKSRCDVLNDSTQGWAYPFVFL